MGNHGPLEEPEVGIDATEEEASLADQPHHESEKITDTLPRVMEGRETRDSKSSEKVAFNNMPGQLPLHNGAKIDHNKCRYPHCIVWTPIPCLTWLFPIIGHMGIATSTGVIRDFAGPYYVSEDDMAFGRPTKYWQLDLNNVPKGKEMWDRSVADASEEYKHRMHNLCCDNCHSHVAMALNLMNYSNSSSYNMVKLCFLMLIYGKYVSFCGFLKTWLPFLIMAGIIATICAVTTQV